MTKTVLDKMPELRKALKYHQKQKALKRPRVVSTANPQERKTAPAAVVDVLSYVGSPLRNQTIISLAQLKLDVNVPRTRFGTLRREGMQRAISNAGIPEGIYPLPALSSLTFKPIEGYLALSNWRLEQRLVTPESEGLLGIRYTKSLLCLYDEGVGEEPRLSAAIHKMGLDLCGKDVGYLPTLELVEVLNEHCDKLIEAHHPREESSIQSAIEVFNSKFIRDIDAPLWQLVGLPDDKTIEFRGEE